MAHKDLSEGSRAVIEAYVIGLTSWLAQDGQSLGIAREAMIAVFDKAAEQLSAQSKQGKD